MENIMNTVVIPFVKDLALAIVVLLVGLFIISKVVNLIEEQLKKSKMDTTLQPFIKSLVSASLKVLLAISVVGILGVETSSFVAVLAAGGFAIGLAFQGALSNFAGGVLLLVVRPINVGDYIEVGDFTGTVESINILNTELKTVDNKVIYMPNGNLADENIVNYSVKDTRRVDLVFGAGYEQDAEHVKRVLMEVIEANEKILEDPEPLVRMTNQGDSTIDFIVKAWVVREDYLTVKYDLMEQVKARFDEEEISIPFPQMDIHMDKM